MSALTKDRDTFEREGTLVSYDVAAAVEIFKGALVVLDSSGNAKPGVTGTGLIAAGRAEEHIDNSAGSAADLQVLVREGVFQFANSAGGDEITKAQIGDSCYIVDDQTVAKTSGGSTRSVAGWVRDVDSAGVYVQVKNIASADGDLVAANNLSDVANAATARSNLGANKVVFCMEVVSLADTAEVPRFVVPVAGTISKIYSVINGVLTTGDATLTSKINGTNITNGAITITQSGSAAGDVDSATPSALNTVVAGDVLSFAIGGTNASATQAKISVLLLT